MVAPKSCYNIDIQYILFTLTSDGNSKVMAQCALRQVSLCC